LQDVKRFRNCHRSFTQKESSKCQPETRVKRLENPNYS
jgi:hypothetical protein